MELIETTHMMIHNDYKERFKAEYYQLKIRLEKLEDMLDKWNNGTLSFEVDCPKELYEEQTKAMNDYLKALKKRAEIEHILL